MRVHVEAEPDSNNEASKTAASRMLYKRIKDVVGVSTEIDIRNPGEVDRSQGKAVRVVDNRPKE